MGSRVNGVSRLTRACGVWVSMIPLMHAGLTLAFSLPSAHTVGLPQILKDALMPYHLWAGLILGKWLARSWALADPQRLLGAWHALLTVLSLVMHYGTVAAGMALRRGAVWPRRLFAASAGIVVLGSLLPLTVYQLLHAGAGAWIGYHAALVLVWGAPWLMLRGSWSSLTGGAVAGPVKVDHDRSARRVEKSLRTE